MLEEARGFERFVSDSVHVFVEFGAVRVKLLSRVSGHRYGGMLIVGISVGEESNWPPSSLVQACTSCLSPLPTLDGLHIDAPDVPPGWLIC